jgi:hypothetical protein
MANYSATEVISPAIERTKRFLFQPFRLGRFLKLTLVAALTEGGISSCNFNSSIPGKSGGKSGPSGVPNIPNWHMPQMHWPAMPVLLASIAAIALVVIVVFVLISYLLIRLRFAYFDCVLYEQDQIAPAWARYHRQALRFLGLGWCIGLAWLVVMVPVGYSLYEHFKPLFASMGSAKPPGFVDFLPLIGVVLLIVLLLSLVGYVVNAMLGCFVLPRMALEDASIRESLEDVWSDLLAEPGAFALFLLFRALLGFAATLVAVFALVIVAVIVALVCVICGLILKAISQTLLVMLGIPALILVFLLALPVMIGISGTIGTFQRNYAILFYAGRYREIAMALWPPPPPFPTPMPPPAPLPPTGNWPGSAAGPEATGA